MGMFSQSDRVWEREFRAQVKGQIDAAAPVVVAEMRDKSHKAALARIPDANRVMADHGYNLKRLITVDGVGAVGASVPG